MAAILHLRAFGVQTLLMPEEKKDAPDLLDLKLLPAWLRETPNENRYADFAGEEPGTAQTHARPRFDRDRGEDRRERRSRPPRPREQRPRRHGAERQPEIQPARPEIRRDLRPVPSLPIVVRFVPDRRVLESVLAQIKSGHVAYSVFALARMFLERPERYDVQLKAQEGELFQLGENGPVSNDPHLLENGAFASERNRFYRSEVTQSEPIKGNFQSVARCRLSGTLLGPTNHHAYQAQLRNLYEQRFSRRMSFPDYQRQIEIVTDPETIERWKEEARSITTYVTLAEEPPITFKTAAETERHFRENYLPGLLRRGPERTVDGVVSRQLLDRSLGRFIENSWAQEFRSPTKMMQELSLAFRQAGLQIFRHRKGMLFVSPIRARPFSHSTSSISPSIAGIVAALTEKPGINRKQLLDELGPAENDETRERMKRTLAADLHWLIREGYVIEFNDGALDLPRAKAGPPVTAEMKGTTPNGTTAAPAASPNDQSIDTVSPPAAAASPEGPAAAATPTSPSATTDLIAAEESGAQNHDPPIAEPVATGLSTESSGKERAS